MAAKKSLRQLIELANDTLTGHLDLEQHGGRTITGVAIRALQCLLTLTAASGTTTRLGNRPSGQ